MAEHFVQPPHWEWYIAGYFFFAGLAGGAYTLGTMLRLWGSPRDEAIARYGFLVAFPLCVVCGILLTIDLGSPLRFWHMLINTTPGEGGLNFKYWSPISIGSWALLVFSAFSFVSFLEVFNSITIPNTAGRRIFNVLGSIVALFLCSYTGVVLAVSNQPVWSDSWALGGLFVASALSGSAALLSWGPRKRPGGAGALLRLHEADKYFAALELILIVVFFVTLSMAGTLGKTLGGVWLVLWVLVIASLLPPIFGLGQRVGASGGAATAMSAGPLVAASVIAGVLLMRIAVIFSAQF